MIIRHIADNRIRVGTIGRGRSRIVENTIALRQRDNLGGMAADLAHEVTHHILGGWEGMDVAAQEMVAWSLGLHIYERMPVQHRRDSEYNWQSHRRQSNPVGWLGRVCRSAARSYGVTTDFCF